MLVVIIVIIIIIIVIIINWKCHLNSIVIRISPRAEAVVKDESDGSDAARSHNPRSTFWERIVKIEMDLVTTV